jgi:hypothetical protein
MEEYKVQMRFKLDIVITNTVAISEQLTTAVLLINETSGDSLSVCHLFYMLH